METAPLIQKILILGIPILIAITFHEAAHGFVALSRGDETAFRLGRVTLNPLKHIDPMGTILIPGLLLIMHSPFLFGYAKPVPVNFSNLKNPRSDMVLVAAAGPMMNFLLALVSALLFHTFPMVSPEFRSLYGDMLLTSLYINVVLGVFNLLPLPPLDGGRVAVGLLPRPLSTQLARVERYGFLIIIGVIFILPSVTQTLFGRSVNFFRDFLSVPIEYIVRLIQNLAGI